MLEKMVSSEELFLRYAFPCAEGRVQRGEMSPEDLHILENAVHNRESLPQEFLEKTFPQAYSEMKAIAIKEGKNPWDKDVVESYWHHGHNKLIDEERGEYEHVPDFLRKECKTHYRAKATDKLKDGQAWKVSYDNKDAIALNLYNLEVKKDGEVSIHKGVIAEVISDD